MLQEPDGHIGTVSERTRTSKSSSLGIEGVARLTDDLDEPTGDPARQVKSTADRFAGAGLFDPNSKFGRLDRRTVRPAIRARPQLENNDLLAETGEAIAGTRRFLGTVIAVAREVDRSQIVSDQRRHDARLVERRHGRGVDGEVKTTAPNKQSEADDRLGHGTHTNQLSSIVHDETFVEHATGAGDRLRAFGIGAHIVDADEDIVEGELFGLGRRLAVGVVGRPDPHGGSDGPDDEDSENDPSGSDSPRQRRFEELRAFGTVIAVEDAGITGTVVGT